MPDLPQPQGPSSVYKSHPVLATSIGAAIAGPVLLLVSFVALWLGGTLFRVDLFHYGTDLSEPPTLLPTATPLLLCVAPLAYLYRKAYPALRATNAGRGMREPPWSIVVGVVFASSVIGGFAITYWRMSGLWPFFNVTR